MGNIVLIGMPASGKSTVGVILAKLLGYDFIDTDLVLQRREGCRLSEIIARRGIDAFLTAEEAACLSVSAEHCVIATGGSVVYSPKAMDYLRSLGCIAYLSVDYATLLLRLGDIQNRGVVLRPGQTLAELYAERVKLCREYADITIAENDQTLEETVQAVMRAYEGWAAR